MINLKKELSKIEQQKKTYKILLNRSRYRQELENRVWEEAAELASGFDLASNATARLAQERNQKGLLLAFQTIRRASKSYLTVPLVQDVHAQAMAFTNSQGGLFRLMRAYWLNSVMVLANWEKIPYLMTHLISGINQKRVPAFYWDECADRYFQHFAHNPVMQAIESNYNTVAIHPFSDGNKRAARLVSAWVLDKYGHIPLSIYDREAYLSGVEDYYTTRRPHSFYHMMLDQMRRSYDSAICEAKSMEVCRVPVVPNRTCRACASRA